MLARTSRYPARVFYSDEDEGFIAVADDLPGCSAFGDTQHEALDELQNAVEAWLSSAEAAGNPIPAPSKQVEQANFSGRILVRMPRELHSRLARSASRENVSLNQYIVFLLTLHHTERTQNVINFGSVLFDSDKEVLSSTTGSNAIAVGYLSGGGISIGGPDQWKEFRTSVARNVILATGSPAVIGRR